MIIGITGKKRSGKDTTANLIVTHYNFHKLSFAHPIKLAAQMMLDTFFDDDDKETIIPYLGVSYRHILQTLGTEWGREQIHPDIWVILALKKIKSLNLENVVFSDLRFPNEANAIRDNNGFIIHIIGPKSEHTDNHASERGLPVGPNDFIIDNSHRNIELLQEQVALVMHKIYEVIQNVERQAV